jgi:hypothetical protein
MSGLTLTTRPGPEGKTLYVVTVPEYVDTTEAGALRKHLAAAQYREQSGFNAGRTVSLRGLWASEWRAWLGFVRFGGAVHLVANRANA